jgi:WD40 repeat protein
MQGVRTDTSQPGAYFDYTAVEVQEAPAAQHQGEVLCLATLPADALYRFLSIGSDGSVFLWTTQSQNPYLAAQVGDRIEAATFEPQYGLLAFTKGTTLMVTSLDLKESFQIELPTRAQVLHFAVDGQSLLIGGKDARIYRWRFPLIKGARSKRQIEKILERYIGTGQVVSAVLPHPDGNLFFSADWAGSLQGWQLYTGDRLQGEGRGNIISSSFFSNASVRTNSKRAAQDERIEEMALDPQGKELLVATSYGDIELWKVRGLLKVASLKAHEATIFSVDFSPNGQLVATAGRDGVMNVYQIHRFTDEELRSKTDRSQQAEFVLVKSLPLPDVRVLRFMNDRQLVGGTKEGTVLLVDIL